jgi:hypothetical protein
MGREHKKRRSMKIKQAQLRKSKLAKLRSKYLEAGMESDKDSIWEKAAKIAPWLTKAEFLTSVKTAKKPAKEEKED